MPANRGEQKLERRELGRGIDVAFDFDRSGCESTSGGVVLAKRVAHTPEHNPWIERRMSKLKTESGLGAQVSLSSLEVAQARSACSTGVDCVGRSATAPNG